MSTATANKDIKIPRGFKPRGFDYELKFTDFNNWYGGSGGIVQKTERVSIIPTKEGRRWQLNSTLFGPGDLMIEATQKFDTLADIHAALTKFAKDSVAAAKQEDDDRKDWERRDAKYERDHAKWLLEQYKHVEYVTVQTVRDERPAAVIGDISTVNEMVKDDWSGYTKRERDIAIRHTLDRNLWVESGRYSEGDPGYTVRKVAIRKDSYRYHERKGMELYSIREHTGGSKLTVKREREETWGTRTDHVDEFELADEVAVIRAFTRPAPNRDDYFDN